MATSKQQRTCSKACREQRLKVAISTKSPDLALSESQDISSDQWKISLPKTRICTLEQLIEYCQVDLTKWRVDSFKVNKWEMGAKQEDGSIGVEPLFQVYAILKPYKELIHATQEIEALKALAHKWAPKPRAISRNKFTTSPHLLELSIYDLHLGKLAWHHETGWSDYDSRIVTETFNTALDTLIERARPYAIDRILLPLGHDFFQVDSPANTTTAGTIVDVDSRFKRTYRLGRQLLCEAIERLRAIAPVDVVMVSGNHDRFSNFTVGDSLECFFRNYTDVTIDNRPLRRKYYRYGNTLIGLTHGDDIKHADLFSLMPVEAPVEFASTTWREWHLGHEHKESLAEKHGIRVRKLPSLCAADEWHAGKGFVGNMRLAESFIFHPTECLVNQSYFHVPEFRPGQQALMGMKKK